MSPGAGEPADRSRARPDAPRAPADGGRSLPLERLTPRDVASAATPGVSSRVARRQRVVAWQRGYGNAYVQRLLRSGSAAPMLQRALSGEEKAKNLRSPRFAGDKRLEQAFDNSPALRRGARGAAVAKIQQALMDDGYQMPKSTNESGEPDGVFGGETYDAVKSFQTTYKVEGGVDGIVGRGMLGRLDELYAGPPAPPSQKGKEAEIAVTEQALGDHVVTGMDKANEGPRSATDGLWYSHIYKAKHKQDPAQFPWNDDYETGYADPRYFVKLGYYEWILKPGVSASDGLRSWLKGFTVAECLSVIVAVQIDTIRAAIGDEKFDAKFGSPDKKIPPGQLLRIRPDTKGTPLEGRIERAEVTEKDGAGILGRRPAVVGGWYYFYNHPRYLLKHPFGAWQGENAVYVGEKKKQQLWSGFGVSNETEVAMLNQMVRAFNAARTDDDYRRLVRNFAADTPEFRAGETNYREQYEKYIDRMPKKYRHDSGEFDDQIDRGKIESAPPYELNGQMRTGGFVPGSGIKIDVESVKELAE